MTIKPEERYLSGFDIEAEKELVTKSKESKKVRNNDDVFSQYRDLKEDKTILDVLIIGANSEKKELFVQMDDGFDIEGVISFRDIDENRNEIKPSYYVGRTFPVMVKHVGEDSNIIMFSVNKAIASLRKYVWDNVKQSIKDKKAMSVIAKVLGYNKRLRCIEIDIYNLGIKGVIHNMKWEQSFLPDIESDINKYIGKMIKVSVIAIDEQIHIKKKDGEKYSKKIKKIVCSRVSILDEYSDNPWKGMGEKYSNGDIIIVTCDRWYVENDKFFGTALGIEGIQILCYDPKKPGLKIEEGKSYKAVVHKVKEEERVFTAKVIGAVDI